MRYLSVCSGIEAATAAWHQLGWTPAAFSEIEPFPSAVLAHHYPNVPNVGDMTKYKEWNLDSTGIDLLVGGTPCQSFSVAGLRKGLDDPRGNLALVYCGMLDHFRPRWFVWENVPGVLSSNGGRDFGAFFGALAELGYGFAYRVLDAQYFGVAQRRRRVFVVGHLGDWRVPAAVLFERESLRRDTAPRREARKEAAGTIARSVIGGDGTIDGPVPPLMARSSRGGSQTLSPGHQTDGHMIAQPITMAHGQGGAEIAIDRGPTLTCNHEAPIVSYGIPGNWIGRKPENGGNAVEPMHDVAPCLTKTDQHGVAHPIPFDTTQITSKYNYSKPKSGDPCHPLAAGAHPPAIAHPVPTHEVVGTLCAEESPHGARGLTGLQTMLSGYIQPMSNMAVRRLTPVECERLQGFPDNYTNIPWRKATESPDGPRYKALGNSMAVPVMHWIGQRIAAVDAITTE